MNDSLNSEKIARKGRIQAAFDRTRQLYDAFERLRKNDLFSGLAYLVEPLLCSLCDLSLLLTTATPRPVGSHREGIEELRQQHLSPSMEAEIKEVVECLERMAAGPCHDVRSARNFSDDVWRILLILRSVSKRLRRSELQTKAESSVLRKKQLLWALLVIVIIACVIKTRAYYHEKLLATMTPDTAQRISDLRNLEKALTEYKKVNGRYPATNGGWNGLYTDWGESSENWIPGLVPNFIDKLPRDPRNNQRGDQQYLYWSDGGNFKLLAHEAPDANLVGKLFPEMYDKRRPGHAIGVWTSGAAAQ